MSLRKLWITTIGLLVLGSSAASYGAHRQHGAAKSANTSAPKWKLVWSDEFNGPDGSAPDPAKWTAVQDGSGFGNRELETYTARPSNVHVDNGNLVITARKESFTGPDGIARAYTSGRLQTAGHFQQQYGRFEARIKLPRGQGLWPAFWLLGDNVAPTGWPACGEIDIMENIGSEPGKVHGSLHGPGYSGANPLTGAYSLPSGTKFGDAFHVFALEWEPTEIRFYVDGTLYETETPNSIPPQQHWAFDHPFFVLLDLAVGGYWPGNPDASTPFPATMLVDYVRVYALASAPQNAHSNRDTK